MLYWPNKTPDEIFDVGLDWGPAVSKFGDSPVITSAWTREEGSVAASSDSIDADGRGTNVRVSGGGLVGEVNTFRNDVTLASGVELQAWATFKIRGA